MLLTRRANSRKTASSTRTTTFRASIEAVKN
jgi:hypothetical protein